MKKIVLTALAVILTLAMTGCSFSYTVSSKTETDANGKTTIHTTTTTNNNGKVTTTETEKVVEATETEKAVEATEAQSEQIVATLAFENASGVNIYGLYFSSAQDENWGENIFANADPLEDGYTRTYENAFRYSSNELLWDMKIVDSDGTAINFRGLDMSKASDPQNITIKLTHEADTNGYFANVQ